MTRSSASSSISICVTLTDPLLSLLVMSNETYVTNIGACHSLPQPPRIEAHAIGVAARDLPAD